MCATGTGTPAAVDGRPDRRACQPPNVRWSTKLQRGAVVEQRRDAQVVGVLRGTSRSEQHLPAHAQVHHQRRRRRSQVQPQVLSAPPGAVDPRCPISRAVRSAGAGLVPADRARMVDPHRGDGLARDVGLQAAADHLDFGKLRHCGQRRDCGSSGFQRVPRRCRGLLLGLLLRPARPLSPYSVSITITVAVNSLSWSGPVELTRYDGTPRPRAAVSSCRLVFQSSPAPSVGAVSSSVAEQPQDDLAGHSRCRGAGRPRPSRDSMLSARMLDLSAPPVFSSPRPSSR